MTLVNIATAPAGTGARGLTVPQTNPGLIDYESHALMQSAYMYASSIKSSLPEEAETMKRCVQSLRDWTRFSNMMELSPVEQASLLTILQLLRTNISTSPNLTGNFAVSAGNCLITHLTPFHRYLGTLSRKPGLWSL